MSNHRQGGTGISAHQKYKPATKGSQIKNEMQTGKKGTDTLPLPNFLPSSRKQRAPIVERGGSQTKKYISERNTYYIYSENMFSSSFLLECHWNLLLPKPEDSKSHPTGVCIKVISAPLPSAESTAGSHC